MVKKIVIGILGMGMLFSQQSCIGNTPDKTTKEQAWKEFANLQDSTRTKVWWFHGETETTREGITADLEAYKRGGVGGVVYYDQAHGKGENAIPAMSQEWWDMLRFAASEAKRVGLSFEANIANGYVAGGPWITPELGMQRLTATETIIKGKSSFKGVLPKPDSKSFSDVAVLAFPIHKGFYETNQTRNPKLSTNLAGLPVESLFGKSRKLTTIPPQEPGHSVFVNLDFGDDFIARSITYRVGTRGKSRGGAMNVPGKPTEKFVAQGFIEQPDLGQLEVSEDGINYQKVCDLKPVYSAASGNWNQKTVSFPAVKGRYFRLNLHDWCHPKDKKPQMYLGDVVLSSRAKADKWEEKAGLYSEYVLPDETPEYSGEEVINPEQVIDLTARMSKDGELQWDVPEGEWMVLRFGHVPTGGVTKHSRANMKGLECDKLSAVAAKAQFDNYFKLILDTLNAAGCPLKGLTMDSQEAGSQNWTAGYEKEFLQRRGYDIHRYLPALMGYIVGSPEETDGFFYDMRRTIADLVSEKYYGTLDSLCRQAGVDFTAQASGNGLNLVADNFQAKGRVQKPQGEFWGHHVHGSYDIKEAASAAHIYGKRIASAEAFTDVRYDESFAEMKNLADYAYAFGVNEFVVCASAYQPWLDKIPGSTGGGRHYCLNRNNTFWEYSRPFWDYQARCAGLMRKGIPVVDLCIFAGDNAPVKLLTYRLPEIPEGYDFDVCTADALIKRMKARDGRIVLPDGMSYQMLVVQRNGDVTLEALRHIASLVEQGVPLYGPKPLRSGSLKDAGNAEEYAKLADRLWGGEMAASGSHAYGKGTVYWGMSLEEALAQAGIRPDIALKSGNTPKDKVYFAHRQLADAEVYFLNNHSKNVFNSTVTLRTDARYAEFWDPATGKRFSLPATPGKDGLAVTITLQANESGFIVASDQLTEGISRRMIGSPEAVVPVEGSWNVYFDPKWGGPGEVVFEELTDWARNADDRIRYYSGTAVYKKTITLDKLDKDEELVLRIPQLGAMAQVFINGKEVSTIWCSPWEADLTPYVQEGDNALELRVVNSLTNRMIGDVSLPQEERYTYAYPEIVKAGDRLVPSGIIGEVLLVRR